MEKDIHSMIKRDAAIFFFHKKRIGEVVLYFISRFFPLCLSLHPFKMAFLHRYLLWISCRVDRRTKMRTSFHHPFPPFSCYHDGTTVVHTRQSTTTGCLND